MACTTVPTRDRDASADSGAMDSMVVVPGDDVASMPDALPDAEVRADAMAQPDVASPTDVVSMPDVAPSCPSGQTRCGSTCIDTSSDANHCGACGMVCAGRTNSTVNCAMGRCTYTCRMGYGDCDRDATNGCEASLDSAMNCGACGVVCSGANPVCDSNMGRCVSGCGPLTRCGSSCVDLTTNAANCGSCGMVCPSGANAAPACAAGRCGLSCNPGYGDCDGNAANGCETNLNTSAVHCGRCMNACPAAANASPVCSAGSCSYTCSAGFGDCDGSRTTGCETNTSTNVSNCGRCGAACAAVANGLPICASGACATSCNRDFGDCDRVFTNGCETVLRANPSNCLGCGVNCGVNGVCQATGCVACSGRLSACGNVCVDTAADVNNCGGCGYACPPVPMGGTPTCTASRCRYGAIGDPRMADCNRNAADGYEVNIDADVNNCGACGTACTSTQQCCNGGCIPRLQMCALI